MILTKRLAEWLTIVFFLVLIATVFQQIPTSMMEQGIATGGPYDNAAAYPRAVAILIAILALVVVTTGGLLRASEATADNSVNVSQIRRPAALLGIFAIYLWGLGVLGYHIATPVMMLSIMVVAGFRKWIEMIAVAVGVSFALAFLFEVFLNIVLPGGIFRLNIPW